MNLLSKTFSWSGGRWQFHAPFSQEEGSKRPLWWVLEAHPNCRSRGRWDSVDSTWTWLIVLEGNWGQKNSSEELTLEASLERELCVCPCRGGKEPSGREEVTEAKPGRHEIAHWVGTWDLFCTAGHELCGEGKTWIDETEVEGAHHGVLAGPLRRLALVLDSRKLVNCTYPGS